MSETTNSEMKSDTMKWLIGILAVIAAILVVIAKYHEVRKTQAEADDAEKKKKSQEPPPPPTVPVVVSFRDSTLGQGKVAIFSNQTSNRLTISVKYIHRWDQPKSRNIDLDPNGKREIGWLESWELKTDDTLEITHPQYSSTKTTVP